MSERGYTLTRDGMVAVLTFDQPDRLNALTKAQMIGFGQACRELAEDSAVRCLLITGEGRGFCSGADMRVATTEQKRPGIAPTRFKDTRLDFITPLIEFPKPVIAAVNGVAVGAGLGIALACDIRICGESGAFLANFHDLGIPAVDGVSWLMPRLTGVSRALEMLYMGDLVEAREAERSGLVSRVVADAALMEHALQLARRIAAKSPVAIQSTKAAVINGLGKSWREALADQEFAFVTTLAFAQNDIAEANVARAEKRAPQFTDTIPFNPDPKQDA